MQMLALTDSNARRLELERHRPRRLRPRRTDDVLTGGSRCRGAQLRLGLLDVARQGQIGRCGRLSWPSLTRFHACWRGKFLEASLSPRPVELLELALVRAAGPRNRLQRAKVTVQVL